MEVVVAKQFYFFFFSQGVKAADDMNFVQDFFRYLQDVQWKNKKMFDGNHFSLATLVSKLDIDVGE